MTAPQDPIDRLLDAALTHVPFDGWSRATFRAAIADTGIDPGLADSLCPRGAIDLARAFHQRGDRAMLARLHATDLDAMRYRDRIVAAVRFRLEATQDREAVRRGVTLFALPQHAGEGAKLIWDTCDLIWQALGDTSVDHNWYSKRVSLAGVYSATVLFWLGDDSPDHQATWDFLDRRIEDIMRVEKFKTQVNENPLLKPLLAGPNWVLSHLHAPVKSAASDLPGQVSRPE